ncbi:hypothetical protein [Kitasatospora sp. NPDC059327]|uniref:hypothetical protein n=1 Tax=Kitasatospora sp. NPDC059327 TaxID=3346803 RepID=UPI00367E8CFB
MPRSALQTARAVARLLGDSWVAESAASATTAVLAGPDELCMILSTGSAATVRMDVRLDARLAWPNHSERIRSVTGTAGGVVDLAEEVTSRVLPAWRAQRAVLIRRTDQARNAVDAVALRIVRLIPSATVDLDGRASTASVRWPGGVAHLRWQSDGSVTLSSLQINDLDQSVGIRLLATLAFLENARPADPARPGALLS